MPIFFSTTVARATIDLLQGVSNSFNRETFDAFFIEQGGMTCQNLICNKRLKCWQKFFSMLQMQKKGRVASNPAALGLIHSFTVLLRFIHGAGWGKVNRGLIM